MSSIQKVTYIQFKCVLSNILIISLSQSHRPFPHYLSRLTDHKDQSLDLSDGDYASDAPSETQFNEEYHTSTATSSSLSFSSDSELKSLEGSMAHCPKKQKGGPTVTLDNLLLLSSPQWSSQKSKLLQKTPLMAWDKSNQILQSGFVER